MESSVYDAHTLSHGAATLEMRLTQYSRVQRRLIVRVNLSTDRSFISFVVVPVLFRSRAKLLKTARHSIFCLANL